MDFQIIENNTFTNIDFSQKEINGIEFENCTFNNCKFIKKNLSGFIFIECEINECDLSNAILGKTSFKDVKFYKSKLIGLQFNDCNPVLLSFTFIDCVLNLSSFFQLKIKSTVFNNCNLTETDFGEADLSKSEFLKCNLNNSIFENTNLTQVDFSTSHNFIIDPKVNIIKQTKFSKEGLPTLLKKYNIEIV